MRQSEHIDVVFETGREFAASDGFHLHVRGHCMSPTLSDGGKTVVRRARFILPGDIVVFRKDRVLVAHRVLGWVPRTGGMGVLTRGDHCDHHDGAIDPARILGRVDVRIGFADRISASLRFVSAVLARIIPLR
jgi:signal peptidase I